MRPTWRRVKAGLGTVSRKLRLRKVAMGLGVFVAVAVVGAITFHASCHGKGEAVPAYGPPGVLALQAEYPDYKRTEESTYLTNLEWYQVFSYQEYAAATEKGRPSDFPYYGAIGQSWSMYCHAYKRTDGSYPFNGGNHLMLGVIGTSFSVEYGVKGAYEKTVGWLTEWDSHDTEEDHYAAAVAKEYGQYVETEPWYAYPFESRAVGLWQDTSLVGPHMLRKVERKVFLTAEYGVKAGYAFIIRQATGAIYGAPPALDYAWVENATADIFTIPGVTMLKDLGGSAYVITVPHYQGFTDAVPVLAQRGVRFVDISGNERIVLTALVPKDWQYDMPQGEVLLSEPVLTHPDLKRILIRTPVHDLHEVLTGLQVRRLTIEHLFDY